MQLSLNLATTPTDKDFYDSLSPALKKRVDAQRSQEDRHKAYADQIKVSKQIEGPFPFELLTDKTHTFSSS